MSNETTSENEGSFDYRLYSKRVFYFINDIRVNPKKYLEPLKCLINKVDKYQNILDLSDGHNLKILLPPHTNYQDSIDYLQSIQCQEPILWCEPLVPFAFDELKEVLKDKNKYLFSNVGTRSLLPLKILADFVVEPQIATLTVLLLSKENREIIFSDKLVEGVVVSNDNTQSGSNVKTDKKTFLLFMSR